MKKKILSVVLALTMTFGMCACGSSTDSKNNSSEAMPKVTLGTTSFPTNMFFCLAEEKGFFEKNGVDTNVKIFSSTTESCNAFIGGQLDFCTMPSSEAISPFAQGGEFSAILETDKSNGCDGLVATSDIKSIADLKGKTVATQVYSVDHMFLLSLLDENGMTEKDINIVDMSIQEAGNAFIAGQCDAACIWDPYLSRAKEAGGTELFSSADEPDLITDILCASKSICKEEPEAVTAVVKSFFEAVDYWEENPDEANEIMGEKLGVTADEFAEEMEGLLIPTEEEVLEDFARNWGENQNTVRDFLYDLEVLDNKDFDCEDMLDTSFIKKLVE